MGLVNKVGLQEKVGSGERARSLGSPRVSLALPAMSPKHEIIGPASRFYVSQRLRLHYVDWGNEDGAALVLVHGGRDHARSWDWVARDLRNEWHVVAPDLRGHGDSSWAIGAHYTLMESVLDLAGLIDTLGAEQVVLVGHSFGGLVSSLYAGTYPERVRKLVSIEGFPPPAAAVAERSKVPAWERTRTWVEQVRKFAGRNPRRYLSIDAAADRMLEENSFLSREQARHLTVHGVSRNEDGSYSWKFDNYSRILYPQGWNPDEMNALWGRITCPTLLVRGTEGWMGNPAKDGRLDAYGQARMLDVEQAGHWVHHDQLDLFVREVRAFLSE